MKQARLIISGLSGSSGKTLLSLGLARALHCRGLRVQPCKKGPDYIDAAWLSLAAERSAANLDPYFLEPEALLTQFLWACEGRDGKADVAIIEGNRGLYDGRDVRGSCSTAQVAMTLKSPVVLALNCAKMTRTAAALVAGVANFEPGLKLAGVVINNAGSARHADQVRQAIEYYTDIPVLGTLPRMRKNPLPERHMGLTLHKADPAVLEVLDELAAYVEQHVDVERMIDVARAAPDLATLNCLAGTWAGGKSEGDCLSPKPRIGFVRDDALWFYYTENLDALQQAGAELIELSLFDAEAWPALDGLYLGGGFPELFGKELAASPRLAQIRALSEAHAPIYAECGGFMVLCQALELAHTCAESAEQSGAEYAMSGVLPVRTKFFGRPQGLGYVEAKTLLENPFHPVGSVWRGHEFHYSRCELSTDAFPDFVLSLTPGTGMAKANGIAYDGLCVRQTFAAYTHLYAPAVPHWAENFVAAARKSKFCAA